MVIEFHTLVMQLNKDWHIFVQPVNDKHTYSKAVLDGDTPVSGVLDKIKEMIHAIRSRNR